ncbi:sarcosine oxidase subunit alpha family protein [Alphaproteobacteria bacterium KMM 3653]|uniref:Sarcosine oxidase subunit alpha family protein n=1 Tax=Harenicola maris TaxID=2841044 RepID=A0AAP2CW32_9RHOB|nr:sarcosine oxidase subunit alpha family protein [Harenicola maris]
MGHGIDRERPVEFTFDGRTYAGFAGDTLASALMANGVRLMGRSFKYHRPRGVLTCGSEEPNALMQIGPKGAAEPNQRATMQEVYPGLRAESQNRWPSLEADLLSVNDALAPFLGAGFYYKTFMWPKAFWERVYEPFIRRAAGLGALPAGHDETPYEKPFAHCDLLVIGGGPAGMSAALAAAKAGADVILAEEQSALGGRLLLDGGEVEGLPAHDWAADMAARLAAHPKVRVMTRTAVTGAYDGGVFGALERVTRHLGDAPKGAPAEAFWRITARASVLAAGAIERPIAFPGNDRPGILMAGALRGYMNRWGVAPGKSIAIYGRGAEALATARQVQAAGLKVAALITTGPAPEGAGGFPVFAEAQVVGTRGRKSLRQVTVLSGGAKHEVIADTLAMSGGWNPSVHLTCHMGARPVWRADIAGFVPAEGSVPDMQVAGACGGRYDTQGCLEAGRAAALAALGREVPSVSEGNNVHDEPEWRSTDWVVPGKGRAWLDFQNDVTVKDVQLAARENLSSVEHMKRYTTQGMAPDQGKNSNIGALTVLAEATGRSISGTGTTTYRPPFVPVPIGAMGAGARGKGFAPERFTTSDGPSRERAAPMVEAGLWYRPSYFPRAGEATWREACVREVRMVRSAVGVCDVSTLGKIDIQGPDAGAFLDFVYANLFSSLKEGRVRYGLMLREDGHVMDDGTTARLGPNHYLMTTTTAAAGAVMKHLDFAAQVLQPNMDVSAISVTEQWAQFAVAGPEARALLRTITDTPVEDADLPYMGCCDAVIGGVAGRIFRISFSGELAYEVAVPARYGASLFRLLLAQAEGLGGGAYGMEALNVLRVEKGFITHAEIHGRVTAYDIGMGRMVSAKKDCIGKAMSQRPGLLDPARPRLVGLRLSEPMGKMLGGAHLFEAGAEARRVNSQGYLTSQAYSPELDAHLALGFLTRGPERIGEVIRVVDHMRGVETMAEVTAPVALDPEGERLRG